MSSCAPLPPYYYQHSKYTVSLTLWGDNATRADLDNVEGRTLQVRHVGFICVCFGCVWAYVV